MVDYYDTVSQSVQLCFRSEAKNAGTALYVTGLSSRRLFTDLMVEDLGGIYALGSR
ncbi:hypothetical protein JHK85_031034 [Glycine max]|nr:hypothetical protein JHK85_031034 [Glycine max]